MIFETNKKIKTKQDLLVILKNPTGVNESAALLNVSISAIRNFLKELQYSGHIKFDSLAKYTADSKNYYKRFITINPSYRLDQVHQIIEKKELKNSHIRIIKERHPTRIKHASPRTWVSSIGEIN